MGVKIEGLLEFPEIGTLLASKIKLKSKYRYPDIFYPDRIIFFMSMKIKLYQFSVSCIQNETSRL